MIEIKDRSVARFISDALTRRYVEDAEMLERIVQRLPKRTLSMMGNFLKSFAMSEHMLNVTFREGNPKLVLGDLIIWWNEENKSAPEGAWFELPNQIDYVSPEFDGGNWREFKNKPNVVLYDFFESISTIADNLNGKFPHVVLLGVAEYLFAEAEKLSKFEGYDLGGIEKTLFESR